MLTRRNLLAAAAGSLASARAGTPADITLRIAEANIELSPKRSIRTLTYNGQAPGPSAPHDEGKSVTVEAINETKQPEMIHWHGFHIPPDVDGAHEEGTPMVQGLDRRSYTFVPQPAGTRWYHTHAMAGHNLKIGLYSGQFGMIVVEPRENPARYDLEVPIVFHEWSLSSRPVPIMARELPAVLNQRKMLGAGEPVRVRSAQRVLFRVLNASATTIIGWRWRAQISSRPLSMETTWYSLDRFPCWRLRQASGWMQSLR